MNIFIFKSHMIYSALSTPVFDAYSNGGNVDTHSSHLVFRAENKPATMEHFPHTNSIPQNHVPSPLLFISLR